MTGEERRYTAGPALRNTVRFPDSPAHLEMMMNDLYSTDLHGITATQRHISPQRNAQEDLICIPSSPSSYLPLPSSSNPSGETKETSHELPAQGVPPSASVADLYLPYVSDASHAHAAGVPLSAPTYGRTLIYHRSSDSPQSTSLDQANSPGVAHSISGSHQRIASNILDLDWSRTSTLLAHSNLLSYGQRILLERLDTKRTHFPHGFEIGNYFANAPFFVAADFTRAESIINCEYRFDGKKRPCRQWGLCSKCAYRKALFGLSLYYPLFPEHSFFHVTCSFDGNLPLDVTNTGAIRNHWASIASAWRKLYNDNLIEGACVVHELSIHSFLPLRVVPHTHVLVHTTEFPESACDTLGELLVSCQDITLCPSIAVVPIRNKAQFYNTIRYQTKAIDLKPAYESGWERSQTEPGRLIPLLNREMKTFLDCNATASANFAKIDYIGSLRSHHYNKSFIGMRTKQDRDGALAQLNRERHDFSDSHEDNFESPEDGDG